MSAAILVPALMTAAQMYMSAQQQKKNRQMQQNQAASSAWDSMSAGSAPTPLAQQLAAVPTQNPTFASPWVGAELGNQPQQSPWMGMS